MMIQDTVTSTLRSMVRGAGGVQLPARSEKTRPGASSSTVILERTGPWWEQNGAE